MAAFATHQRGDGRPDVHQHRVRPVVANLRQHEAAPGHHAVSDDSAVGARPPEGKQQCPGLSPDHCLAHACEGPGPPPELGASAT
eukprot:2348371-Alexandrium_andersonii.AAC.1